MNKKCPTCNVVKDCKDFNKNKKRDDGLQSYCKTCQSEYDRIYYLTHNKDKRKISVKNRLKGIRDWFIKYKKTQCCCKCANNDFRVLEFHHLKDKDFNIGDGVGWGYSIELIKLEIEKCECLCANCHRIVTYEER